MKNITQVYECLTEVNRSRFLTYLVPYSQFEGLQQKLKQEHPKANHVVYALRYLNEYEQVVENSSDDGEPKGCAGVPALNVLRGEEMINCAVLIVRYFGGIKLGTGGMVRAYTKAVKDVLECAELLPYEKEIMYTFTSNYTMVDKILHILKSCGITQIEREFGSDVKWQIKGVQKAIDQFINLVEFKKSCKM